MASTGTGGWRLLSKVLLLTSTRDSAAEILPSLSLLDHTVRLSPAAGSVGSVAATAEPDVVLVDARRDLVRARALLRQLSSRSVPLLAVISEGAWAAISADWGAD